MLKVSNLVKTFGNVHALKGVNLKVPDRTVLGILGMNGSGKTTMLNCINGLYTPTSGSITLSGQDLTGLAAHQVFKAGVGRTFQVPRVFQHMTLMDNLRVALINSGLSSRETDQRCRDWLGRVELLRLSHNYAEELSGGQQKLLELARIMVSQPRLVLLDEPFAGVNPTLAMLLIGIIRKMPQEQECSVVLVSHDLTSVYELSDHIVVLNEGALLAEGDAQAIQTNQNVIDAYLGA